ARPAAAGGAVRDRPRIDFVEPNRRKSLGGAYGEAEILRLMGTEETQPESVPADRRRQPHALPRPALILNPFDANLVGGEAEIRAELLCHLPNRIRGLGLLDPGERRPAGAQDARLLARDGGEGVPQVLAVIEADRGDEGEDRIAQVRGIEPAAEAHFDDGEVHPLLGEPGEGCQGDRFEVGGGSTGLALGESDEVRQQPGEPGGRDRPAVDPQPLLDALEMRGGVEAGAVTGGARHGREERRGRALAVGAGYEDGRESALRLP